ncbi:MAG: transketolase [Candidatus Dormibacteraeota bacterium]|uniref:Transketolase n=1 Tax=Candidatus Amunia macphersoniae TaxID=3127014 RepID=A0A934KKS3_9BACT|nr:transketolase [Candidatus Dormibacteraeota bacterium]
MTVTSNVEQRLTAEDIAFLRDLGNQLRVDGIRASTKGGSGHPSSSMSASDLLAVLVTRHLHYDWQEPALENNDHLIFSKGHASPLIYAVFKACGAIDEAELMTYRTHGSRLQGHPTPILPWVDVATGSLGQGMPIAVGVALAGRAVEKLPFHVWTICGDSEIAEGSIWEGLDKAGHYGLSNLTAIVDVNRLGQRGPTEFEWDMATYQRRVEAFGCRAIVIDGHDIEQIDQALGDARSERERPTVVLARTIKGKGFSEIEDRDDWHGKPLPPDMAERAIAELGGIRDLRVETPNPEPGTSAVRKGGQGVSISLPTYEKDAKVATRRAYGDALKALGARPDVVVLDGEVSNSTYSEDFRKEFPDRFFEMFIAEQQLVASTVGMGVRRLVPFASTFAAFFSRAYDFIRMAGISTANIRLVGSHAGCEIGADGPSQMALEDLASLRAVHTSVVLYPSDAVSTVKLVAVMAETDGVVYMRTTRGAYPTVYDNDESFEVGGSKVLRRSDSDTVTLIGAGVTLHHCLEAAERLGADGVQCRVIDLYSVKPVDTATLREAVRDTNGNFVVVEDHYPEGGLAAAVLEALAADQQRPRVTHLAVRDLPLSGTPVELMAAAGIDADAIVAAVRDRAGTPGGDV